MSSLALVRPSSPCSNASSQPKSNPTPAHPTSSKNKSPPPSSASKSLHSPKLTATHRRLKNQKSLSLDLLSLSSTDDCPSLVHPGPLRVPSLMDLTPLQTTFPSSASTRKQDISANSTKMISSPSTPIQHRSTKRLSLELPTAARSRSFNNIPSIFNSQPSAKSQLSRALSLKIPTTQTKPSAPSLLPPTRFEEADQPVSPPVESSPQPILAIPTAFQEECMETGVNPYPDGPLFICEPNIYLYSEPTREEASKFDVIINVAREVKNPFEHTPASSPATNKHQSYSSSSEGYSAFSDDLSSIPSSPPSSVESTSDMAMSSPILSSEAATSPLANEGWDSISSSPTYIPKATPSASPEYIYVPWEHNSKLTDDLDMLTGLMQARSREGKRILVHCQCGVSRSASLIVAYVMRMQQLGVHESYEWVKSRASNISPNMTLIFQLMEWGKMCAETEAAPTTITTKAL